MTKFKFKLYNLGGIILAFVLFAASVVLLYILLHNPHKDLHAQIFKTADTVRSYYRDQPGFWKLSTQTAKDNGLIKVNLSTYKDYELNVGKGENGDIVLPGDLGFDIALKHLNRSACIALSEISIDLKKQLGLQKITIINAEKTVEFTWGGTYGLPIGKLATRDVCNPTENTIIWTFQ